MANDNHIRLLPLHVANKIAAGEVVERPASVLKELLENAIDAGATRIEINVTAGGRKLVSVRDNGCGMTREDALLSLERQATSKIRDVDDIERISTLGFRGEAIPSIASVSRFTLVTRRAGSEEGTQLTVNAGTLAEVKTCGTPPGTVVEVRDLFCNVPARRKFLRTYATEEGHIRAVYTVHALAHPDIGFSLAIDGREIYRLAPGATLEERIRDLFGASFAESLVPVDATCADVRVHGYVERPDVRMETRREQYVFTNGRPATAAAIGYALREAYPRRNAENSRPAVVLFIDLDPSQVDVNVHPAKREVRFRRPGDVREAIISAITGAFAGPDTATETITPTTTITPTATITPEATTTPQPAPEPFLAPFQPSLPRQAETPTAIAAAPEPAADMPHIPHGDDRLPAPPLAAATGPWRWFRFLAMTESGYLLIETDGGLVTVNPIAARERIVFERLLDAQRTASQSLLIPETVQLGPIESARLKSFKDVLESQGFVVEEFGRDTWKIDAVPQVTGGHSAADLLATIAHDLAESGSRRGGARWREELVARSVARSFAGAEPRLTPETATKLVTELGSCRTPYVCPRGKPVMIFTSLNDLKRKFG